MSRESSLPTRDEIAAWEMRVMSVGHGVLGDSEWRKLIDGYELLRDTAADATLDHSCGLEGWDEDCAECRLARLLWEEQAYREGVTQAPKNTVLDIGDPSVTPGSIT